MSMLLRRYHEKGPDGSVAGETLERPAKSASKADWVAYAAQEGHETDGLTKEDLQGLFPEEPAE